MSTSNSKRDVSDASGFLAAARDASGSQYLGDWSVVDRLLRELASGVLTRYHEVATGVLTPADASGEDQAECKRLAGIFTGQDASYTAVKDWTGTGLADHLRQQMGTQIDTSEEDAGVVAQALAVFVHGVYGVLRDGLAESQMMSVILNNIAGLRMSLLGAVGND